MKLLQRMRIQQLSSHKIQTIYYLLQNKRTTLINKQKFLKKN